MVSLKSALICYELGKDEEQAYVDVLSQINMHLNLSLNTLAISVNKESANTPHTMFSICMGGCLVYGSLCVPGRVGIPSLVLGAVCRALVVGDGMSYVEEEWKVGGGGWWMGMRMRITVGALGLYGSWTLTWLQCWCLHLESINKS